MKCPECGSTKITIDDELYDGEPDEGIAIFKAHCIQKEWYDEHWFKIKFDLVNPEIV